jgi:hypothetical protein
MVFPNPLQALTLGIHIPIVKIMGMMRIIVLPFIQNLNKVNHKQPMVGKVKILEKAKMGKVQPIKGQPSS